MGYRVPGRDDRHYINICDNNQGFLSSLHFKSREGLYSAIFLWREREQVHMDGAEQCQNERKSGSG